MSELPKWPPLPIVYKSEVEPYKSNTLIRHVMDERDAWEARCRLAVQGLVSIQSLNHPASVIAEQILGIIGPLPNPQSPVQPE